MLLKESMIVGIYTTIIAVFLFYLIQIVNKSSKILLSIRFFFVLGFLKHFLGYYLNLQTEYCNQGVQCKKNRLNFNLNLKAIQPSLLENSGEGLAFVLMGLLFTNLFKIKNLFLIAFLIGFSLHIFSDLTGIHTYFCKYYCV
jgi:hypothetical protein